MELKVDNVIRWKLKRTGRELEEVPIIPKVSNICYQMDEPKKNLLLILNISRRVRSPNLLERISAKGRGREQRKMENVCL